jgi:molecular chaperone DnaK (HSP70)
MDRSSEDLWRKKVRKGDLVLVCDIGGGTADFSLIRVSEDNGELALERIAVGDHLLVGGDNMDLALAYHLSRKMAEAGNRLDHGRCGGLVQSCRSAKEAVLSDAGCRVPGDHSGPGQQPDRRHAENLPDVRRGR